MKEKKEKQIAMIIVGIVAVVLVGIGISYAWYELTLHGTKEHVIMIGDLKLALTNEANEINMTDTFPMTDEDGLKLTPYTFTITNTGNVALNYTVRLIDDETQKAACTGCKFLPVNGIKYSLKMGATAFGPGIVGDNRVLGTGRIEPGEANKLNGELRLWVDSVQSLGAAYQNANFFGKIQVEGAQIPVTNAVN